MLLRAAGSAHASSDVYEHYLVRFIGRLYFVQVRPQPLGYQLTKTYPY